MQRSEQLERKGKGRDFILILAKEAKAFMILYAALRSQLSTAREFGNVIKAYHNVHFLGELQRRIDNSENGIKHRIKQLD